jgi:hypothetical protein
VAVQNLIQLGPLIGGAILLLICLVNIIRSPGISNANVVVLGLGALMFAIPTLASFNIDSPVLKISGQVQVQGAELKRDLTDIRQMVESLAKASGQTSVAASVVGTQNRSSLVFVVYAESKKTLAQQFEKQLLIKGYTANAIFSDFTELSASQKGASGSIQFGYKHNTSSVAKSVKSDLQSQIAGLHPMADIVNDKLPVDVQILLF